MIICLVILWFEQISTDRVAIETGIEITKSHIDKTVTRTSQKFPSSIPVKVRKKAFKKILRQYNT